MPGVCPPRRRAAAPPRRREGPRDRRAVRRPGTTTRAPPPRSLKRAYAKKEPIAVTLWSPHWACSDYALPPELSRALPRSRRTQPRPRRKRSAMAQMIAS
ncbi:glycine betaine ABC transporter substrate-binding protein [Streptomyces ipomoeae]|nr:glycine betaine ABC transporter substrate-binding protein [Streptomyces ipomoeae]MDX2699562.1 glycine betaine ABC transporter substrate-binding protein [Streptomyces ipomoeae]MDX2840866.1 glycine betaine ABC transporter substrate-binding protein [Streptomyces ipomoeae]